MTIFLCGLLTLLHPLECYESATRNMLNNNFHYILSKLRQRNCFNRNDDHGDYRLIWWSNQTLSFKFQCIYFFFYFNTAMDSFIVILLISKLMLQHYKRLYSDVSVRKLVCFLDVCLEFRGNLSGWPVFKEKKKWNQQPQLKLLYNDKTEVRCYRLFFPTWWV